MSRAARYRDDPNYYRLGYQLAAQQLNRAIASTSTEARASHARAAFASAESVIDDATAKVENYDYTEAMQGRWQSLEPRQQRLRRFLKQTVVPCAEVVRAGALLAQGKKADAERLIEPLKERAAETTASVPAPYRVAPSRLSYRVYYNLACYEGTIPPERPSTRMDVRTYAGEVLAGYDVAEPAEPYEQAMSYLFEAFRRCHGRRRGLLARWAELDPAFHAIREDALSGRVFRDLVASCKLPDFEGDEDPAVNATVESAPPVPDQ